MNPHTHFLLPFLIGLIFRELGVFSLEQALLCGLFGVLVDIDHYIEYVMQTGKFSLVGMWNNAYKYHRFEERSFIHHLEGMIIITFFIMIIAAFNWQLAWMLAIAYYSHMVLDYLHLKKEKIFSWKFLMLYMRESRLELILDLVFVVGLLTLL